MTGMIAQTYTSCNGWTHMLLDVTGQMRYCSCGSWCFLISDTSWRLRMRFLCLPLSLSPSVFLLFFVLREIPTGSEKYPLLPCTSKKHYHMLSCFAPASCQKVSVQQTKELYEKWSHATRNTVLSGSSLCDPFVLEVTYVKFWGAII